jgi:hypothetical protein
MASAPLIDNAHQLFMTLCDLSNRQMGKLLHRSALDANARKVIQIHYLVLKAGKALSSGRCNVFSHHITVGSLLAQPLLLEGMVSVLLIKSRVLARRFPKRPPMCMTSCLHCWLRNGELD